MKENVMNEQSFQFATRIVKLRRYLINTKQEYDISKQLLRSGTSIGANINEADYAQSKADFITKLQIALKEAAETEYWIKLLYAGEYITKEMEVSLLQDCVSLKRILVSALNTAKSDQ